MGHTRITYAKRYVIQTLNKRGDTKKEITDEIGMDKSTVSRELRRSEGQRGYRCK